MSVPSVDLHTLELCRIVAKAGSVSKGAEQVGMSQSALSRKIQALEAELDVALFKRTTRTFQLTSIGEQFLAETQHLQALLHNQVARLQEQHLSQQQTLRMGISEGIPSAHIPGLFSQKHYQETLKFIISQDEDSVIQASVLRGEIDLALVVSHGAPLQKGLQVLNEITDEMCLIAPAKLEGELDLTAIEDHWILPNQGSATREAIDRWFGSQGYSPRVSMEIENVEVVLQLVALGHGISLVPSRALASFPRKHLIQKRKLDKTLNRSLVLVTRSDEAPSPLIETFLKHLLFS